MPEHCWPNAPQDCCIVGGRSGKLAVFRDGAFASHLAAAPGAAITCLEIFSDGFVCATDGGIFLRSRFDVEQVHGNAAQLFRVEARYEIGVKYGMKDGHARKFSMRLPQIAER